MSQSHERRRFSRIPFEASVTLTSPKGKWMGKLVDISLKGVLITRPQHWTTAKGEQVLVEIHPPEDNFSMQMEARVVHENDSIGLQCLHIDIDSASHLRRLVELNLGDETILNRELSVMWAA